MARDGRGNPGRIVLKNQPSLTLANVLRRRRTTLKAFVQELGLTTYGALKIWCDRMGIDAPSIDDFATAFPVRVNSPTEGVVVLEALPVIEESTGRILDVDAVMPYTEQPVETTEGTQKKRRSKKDDQPNEP